VKASNPGAGVVVGDGRDVELPGAGERADPQPRQHRRVQRLDVDQVVVVEDQQHLTQGWRRP
jgi:hypothetical protein